jgi:hypothetical protein
LPVLYTAFKGCVWNRLFFSKIFLRLFAHSV